MQGTKSSFFQTNSLLLSFKFVKCYWAFTSGRRFWLKLWRKWMPIDEIAFAVSCSSRRAGSSFGLGRGGGGQRPKGAHDFFFCVGAHAKPHSPQTIRKLHNIHSVAWPAFWYGDGRGGGGKTPKCTDKKYMYFYCASERLRNICFHDSKYICIHYAINAVSFNYL